MLTTKEVLAQSWSAVYEWNDHSEHQDVLVTFDCAIEAQDA